MRILVTGGTGYIGSHTCVELLERGYELVAVDDLVNSSAESLRRVERITGKAVPFVELDLRDEDGLRQVFRDYAFDAVIHFAGLKAVGESVAQPLRYYENNLGSTISLLKVMGEFGVKKIIFSSSATVYMGDNEMPLRETSRTGGCTNPYGWTKYMIEQILSGVAAADKDWSVVLLRYFNPVGAHESGLIGEDPQGIPNNLMPYISQTAAGVRECLTIFGDDYPTPDGTCIRDYIHIVDLARGHVAALDYLKEHTGCEVFNLGTGRGVSVKELVAAFETATGITLNKKIGARRPGDNPITYADPAKSEQILHWRATHSVEDMCRDSWNWQSQNPHGYK